MAVKKPKDLLLHSTNSLNEMAKNGRYRKHTSSIKKRGNKELFIGKVP